jgi:N-6 DNA Methylase/Eco57I restriction-modification methylase
MIRGISGSLLSEDALERVLPDALGGLLGEGGRGPARRRLLRWHTPLRQALGPASGPRTIFDRLAAPLFSQLGYRVVSEGAGPRSILALLQSGTRTAAGLVVTGWGQDAGGAWRDVVRHGIGHALRWCFCCTGQSLRIVDTVRTYSRRFVEFELDACIDDEKAFAVFWGLIRPDAMLPRAAGAPSLLELAIAISEQHRASVRESLQSGVTDALAHLSRAFADATASRRRKRDRRPGAERDDSPVLHEALIVLYRVLFLLFAEARGLVPRWHPVYRDGYTIEALRASVEELSRPRGLWETMQSIARLAHRGCRIGALEVTPFNGRLFSPVESPLADTVRLDDGVVRLALLALTTRASAGGRERIAYGDLGVEQLGGVYERVLDLDASHLVAPLRRTGARVRTSDRRKTTGSFYTPRSLTEFVVRRTLAPLVHDASPEQILSLRVLDPAMGSGAFLVAACRYLAGAYEAAVRREGRDVEESDRVDFRRMVAQRCLYGVDLNPMAVQLGRLSLWLATLAADRPLTFLDHRLRAGNSLVGASAVDLTRQPAARRSPASWKSPLPLFDDAALDDRLRQAIAIREAIAAEPGNTLADIRGKEQALERLAAGGQSLARWKSACDVWCSWWFARGADPKARLAVKPLLDSLAGRDGLPDHVVAPVLQGTRDTAARERFFHWTLEFPEVFEGSGGADGRKGFDAIVGNPPWEMLRGDRGDQGVRAAARSAAAALTGFAHGSGLYALQGGGHTNLYQLFLERMLQLLRNGGRLGAILPFGLAIDHGAAPLRRALLEHTAIDSLISFENRDGVFPIHRGLKFLLLFATTGRETGFLPCRFGVRNPDSLDELSEMGPVSGAIVVTRALLERLSGDELAIPDVRNREDVELLGHLAFAAPALGSAEGWNVTFGRELNATEDRQYFRAASSGHDASSVPVIEGKHLRPFGVDLDRAAYRISSRIADRLLGAGRAFRRSRLAYRDVAAATNRLTLIAAIVPAGAVTTHTVFCLKDPLPEDDQWFLCGMFNSFVANYFVRLRVGTHVTTTIIDRLPMPAPARDSLDFRRIVALARRLAQGPPDADAQAHLHAVAARLYALDTPQFRRVLDTFPLVPRGDRERALRTFCDIV